MYVQFSQPMKAVDNLDHIQLMDSQGNPVRGAIFQNVYELWDETQTQLTLIFDPARVKTGLEAHERFGRALRPGETYQLVIRGFTDIHHQSLGQPYTKTFFVTETDTLPPNIHRWEISLPPVGSSSPLVLRFPDILDQMSLKQRITIATEAETLIEGNRELGPHEKAYHFIPTQVWQPGKYFIVVHSRLADPAGNNLNGLFDHPTGSLRFETEEEVLKIPFRLR